MTKNTIPRAPKRLISNSYRALTGLQQHGAAYGLVHSTPTNFAATLYALDGEPEERGEVGKEQEYDAAVTTRKNASKAVLTARQEGRGFCAKVIDVLKPRLGRRWNAQWQAAGFQTPSLRLPEDPAPMLARLRTFLLANPINEVPEMGVTAARCDLFNALLRQAGQTLADAQAVALVAKKARDAAREALYQQMVTLREELDLLFRDDDERWYRFGFKRPVDGEIPDQVEGLALRAVTEGEVEAEWLPATLAQKYRVAWQVKGSTADPVKLPLTEQRSMLLRELPSGQTVVVRVTAVNPAGETVPTEAEIVVG